MKDKKRFTKKEFSYRGKNIDELKNLDVREFAKHLKSKERRNILRKFDVVERFIKKCEKRKKQGKAIKTHLRNIIIVPRMVGLTVGVYNGREFVNIKLEPEMIGHKLGEFSVTRGKVQHGSPGIGATKSSASQSVK